MFQMLFIKQMINLLLGLYHFQNELLLKEMGSTIVHHHFFHQIDIHM